MQKTPRSRRRLKNLGASTVDACVDAVFGKILASKFEIGERLPAERALSTELRASRVSVRHALQRIADWRVISIRHGSGAVVRPRREWNLPVLPAVVFYWMRKGDPMHMGRFLTQMLEIRRILYSGLLKVAARTLSGRRLEEQRRELETLTQLRDRPAEFAVREIDFVRNLLAAAELDLLIWTLNTLAEVYIEIAEAMQHVLPVPPDLSGAYTAYFDHVERGEPDAAAEVVERYIEQYDKHLISLLTGLG